MEEGQIIGKISHFYPKISVCVVDLMGTLKAGDTIQIKGTATDFTQQVESMQVEHTRIEEAKKGDSVGLKVEKPVKPNDVVYLITP